MKLPFLLPSVLASLLSCLVGCSGSDAPSTSDSTNPTSPSGSGSGTSGGGTSGSSGAASSSSSSSSGATGASACEAVGTELCARACSCATDGKCHVGVDIDAGMAASINFDDEDACRDFYVKLGCFQGGEPGFDYATCGARLKASSCVESAGGQAILFPAECRVSK